DYYVENENINITSDTVINVLEGDWDTFTGYTVSGTLTRADANGKTAYLKLVEQGAGYTDTALYKAVSSVFAGGIATYSKDDVFTENYTGWIFIDMNGNVNASNPLPDTGDYYATTDINVSGNTVINVNEGDWSTL
ncbi:MAG: hypothetical protein JXB50_15610, partial [Spirochaetes bacterium]|nr:hypothetical protein [Spirochaetota bacterium]